MFSRIHVLFLAVLAVSSAAQAAPVNYRCDSTSRAERAFTFLVSIDVQEPGISERNRSAIYVVVGNRPFAVEGCAPAEQAELTRRSLYVECIADGDAGYLNVRTDRRGKLHGTMIFPEGSSQFDLDQDTSIPLVCQRTR